MAWEPAPSEPRLPRLEQGDVHVWRADLDRAEDQAERLEAILSCDELQRAQRFRFDRHRTRFVVARAILRTLLARYLGITPPEVTFRYNVHGKPALASEQGADVPSFNLSHSEGLALYAVGRAWAIGVDLEPVRSLSDGEAISERCFSRREREAWRALPSEQRPLGFFNCWTRKEAYVKALGSGLSCALDAFDVSLMPGEPARLL